MKKIFNKIYIFLLFFIVAFVIIGGCEKNGPCEPPLRWKIESVDTPDISVKINKKDVKMTVQGEGTIVFKCKNKKEKFLCCNVNIDDEWQNSETPNLSEFKNSFASVIINNENGTVTMSFKDLPGTDTSMLIYVEALEVCTPFYVDIKVR